MTESEWLQGDEPETLLEFVEGRMSARKRRLLAASFCRHVMPLTGERCVRIAIEIAERYADGLATLDALLAISERVFDAYVNVPNPAPANTDPPLSVKAESIAIQSAGFLTRDSDDYLGGCRRCTHLATLRWAILRAGPDETIPPYPTLMRWQTLLVRELAGNPFRPVFLDSAWLTVTVIDLARAAYEARSLPSGELDPDRLAVLSDALEEAGCDDADILNHLRGPGPHVRGCWGLDLLLGKE